MTGSRSATGPVVDDRTLNRTLLQRQLLLGRQAVAPETAVDALVGLQAQVPLDPYTALWARLDGFDPDELGRLLLERQVVRIVSIRGTLHLLTAQDCATLWPLFRPVYERELAAHPATRKLLPDLDSEAIVTWGRRLLRTPRSLPELKRASREQFPELDPAAVAIICRNRIGLVQTPPRGVWGKSAQVTLAEARSWLGRPFAPVRDQTVDELVLRYLEAFGPASTADIGTWSRLTGLSEVIERLSPQLRPFRTEHGRTVWDHEAGSLADPDVPAPVRILPEYDNVLLSHSDRRRIADREASGLYPTGELGRGHILVDGHLRASWRLTQDTFDVRHLQLSDDDLGSLCDEAGRLLEFLRPGEVIPMVLNPTAG